MRALVVYESMFGATRDVARALADAMAARLPIAIVEVSHAPVRLPDDLVLLVVGGPTHARGMSRPASRAMAGAGDRALVSREHGIREWLERLPPGQRAAAAAFDTRFRSPAPIWGSAAKLAAARLDELGFSRAADPVSFYVGDPGAPEADRLVPGELDRARAWGAALADAVVDRA